MKQMYDYIIYGATLSGIAASISACRAGYSVLLINYYGFPGGNITEGLCCMQLKHGWQNTDSFAESLIKEAAGENWGILFEDENKVVLNPETVKYLLLQKLTENGVDLLFHVQPCEVIKEEDHYCIHLLAKEGIIKAEAKELIDASDNMGLASFLSPVDKSVKGMKLNIFTTKLPSLSDSLFDIADNYVLLPDQRAWVSMNIDETDLLEAEKASQRKLEEISSALEKAGARLQIVPPCTYVEFESRPEGIKLPAGVYYINSLLQGVSASITGSENELTKAFETEKMINSLSLFK